MRVSAVVCVVLLLGVGAKGDFFDDLLQQVLKPAGQQLVQAGQQALLQLLMQGVTGVGKRGIEIDEVKRQQFLLDAADLVSDKLTDAIMSGYKELMELANSLSSLSWVNQGLTKRELHQAVDMVVAKNQQKIRDAWTDILQNLGNLGIGLLGQTVQTGLGELQNLLNGSVGKRDLTQTISNALQPHIDNAVAVAGQVGNTIQGHINNLWNTVQNIGQLPDKLQTHVDTITGHVQNIIGHGTNAISSIQDVVTDILTQTFQNIGSNVQGIVSTGGDAVNTVVDHVNNNGKRDLAQTISNALQPHIDNAVNVAGQVSNTIQGHVNNLWNTVQSLGQLPDKLQTHVDTITGHVQNIIGHGTNAISSIQDVVTDILTQTFQNIGSNVQGIVSTGGDAVNTVVDHVNNNGKRDLVQTISNALQPHIDNAVNVAGQVSNTIQGHVNNLWNTVQSLGQLPDKLQTHVDTITGHVQNIIGHGTNAISSIQDVVTDILNQTFQNIGGNVQGIVSTGGDAVNTAINHVTGGGN